jgi:hypothetical protein
MAKRETLHLGREMSIETGTDGNQGRWYVAYRKGCSMYFTDVKELRSFLKLPTKTASRASLDSWLDSLKGTDQGAPSLRAVDMGSTWGPEAHLDETDPNYQTRAVI